MGKRAVLVTVREEKSETPSKSLIRPKFPVK